MSSPNHHQLREEILLHILCVLFIVVGILAMRGGKRNVWLNEIIINYKYVEFKPI